VAGITLAIAETQLTESLAALSKVRSGQRCVLNGKDLTRADMAAIQKDVDYWDRQVSRLSRTGGMRASQVVPL
jgi:hypothetical protein